jgi:hypothetical protein
VVVIPPAGRDVREVKEEMVGAIGTHLRDCWRGQQGSKEHAKGVPEVALVPFSIFSFSFLSLPPSLPCFLFALLCLFSFLRQGLSV